MSSVDQKAEGEAPRSAVFSKEQELAIRELCAGMKELMLAGRLKFDDGNEADAELEAAIREAR